MVKKPAQTVPVRDLIHVDSSFSCKEEIQTFPNQY